MALPSGGVLRQMTVDDIPASAALNDETWEAMYGRTGYITAELMELGLRRPNQDPERDNPVIVSDGRPIAWAALQAFPPMTEIVCPITVDLTLSPDARPHRSMP